MLDMDRVTAALLCVVLAQLAVRSAQPTAADQQGVTAGCNVTVMSAAAHWHPEAKLRLHCQPDVLSRMPHVPDALRHKISSLHINNQSRLTRLRRSDVAGMVNLESVHIEHTALARLDWMAFAQLPLTNIRLNNNAFTQVRWQWLFAIRHQRRRLDVRGNALDCSCVNRWLLHAHELALPTAIHMQQHVMFRQSVSNVLLLPSHIEHSFNLTACPPSELRRRCRAVHVDMQPRAVQARLGDSASVDCNMTYSSSSSSALSGEEADDSSLQHEIVFRTEVRGRRPLPPPQKTVSVHSMSASVHERAVRAAVHNVTEGHIRLLLCTALQADYPAYNVSALIVHGVRPLIYTTALQPNTFLLVGLNSCCFDVVAYPRDGLRAVLLHLHTNHSHAFALVDQNSRTAAAGSTQTDSTLTDSSQTGSTQTDPDSSVDSHEPGGSAIDEYHILVTSMFNFYLTNVRLTIRPPRDGPFELKVCNEFGCRAVQFSVAVEPYKSTRSTHPPQSSNNAGHDPNVPLYALAALASLLLLLVTVLAAGWCHRRTRRRQKRSAALGTDRETDQLLHIDAGQLRIEERLGSGAFGVVHRATWLQTEVAVKQLSVGGEHTRREAVIMAKMQHPNVVRFHGVSVDGGGRLLLVYEFMELGDLKTYLRHKGPSAYLFGEPVPSPYLEKQMQSDDNTREEYPSELTSAPPSTAWPPAACTNTLDVAALLWLAEQVAAGLAYLQQQRVLHRDLAARNCLLTNQPSTSMQPTVKLSDFGMSRDIYSDEYYRLSQAKAVLPVRWLPPESLVFGKFTPESDIWSLGVVLWELFTYGQVPYAHMSNAEVLAAARQGQNPGTPADCPLEVAQLMRRCWEQVPCERIRIHVLERRLQEIRAQCVASPSSAQQHSASADSSASGFCDIEKL